MVNNKLETLNRRKMVHLNLQQMIRDCGKPEAIAEQIDMHFTSVYRWLKSGNINGDSLAKIVHHYDIDLRQYVVKE